MKITFEKMVIFPRYLYHRVIRGISDYLGSLPVKKYSHSSGIIRRFEDDDLGSVLEIYEKGFGNKNVKQIIQYSQLFRNSFYVYELDNVVVGYLGFYVHFGCNRFKCVQNATAFSGAVEGQAQGKGIFTTLYVESLSELKRNGVQAVYGFIDVNNERSLSIHKKLGYNIVQKVNKICGVEDCYMVELILSDPK